MKLVMQTLGLRLETCNCLQIVISNFCFFQLWLWRQTNDGA